VTCEHDQHGVRCTVGPQSVGQNLTRDALSFGGETCTATDIAVALGRMSIPDGHVTPGGRITICTHDLTRSCPCTVLAAWAPLQSMAGLMWACWLLELD